MDQEIDGTRPVEFDADLRELEKIIGNFAQLRADYNWQNHPIFGQMTTDEWLRWGYLHVDHHLRQFGF
jgi:uncharacterized protein DUF1569